MENNVNYTRMMLDEKTRRKAEKERNREARRQWFRELFCHHQMDYVGYACYAAHKRIGGKRERYMYNIDAVGMCPKCGRIFDFRRSYLKGLSERSAKDTIARLQEGGYVVVIAEQTPDKKLKAQHGTI